MKPTYPLLAITFAAACLSLAPGDALARSGGGGHQASHGVHGASVGHFRGSRASFSHGYRGHRHSGARFGFYYGVPVFWGPWWGYDAYWPRERMVYREVVREPVYEEVRDLGPVESAGTLQPPAAPAGDPVSTSYCASTKAYFPAVRTCPEGWRLTPPNG